MLLSLFQRQDLFSSPAFKTAGFKITFGKKKKQLAVLPQIQ